MEYLHVREERSPKHPHLLFTPLLCSAPAPADANHAPCTVYTCTSANLAGSRDSFLRSRSGRKATQLWMSSVALLFWTPVCYTQWICSFIARRGRGTPPHFIPNSNRTRSDHHQPLMPQQATGEKGKTMVMTKAVAMNTSFPTKEPLPSLDFPRDNSPSFLSLPSHETKLSHGTRTWYSG